MKYAKHVCEQVVFIPNIVIIFKKFRFFACFKRFILLILKTIKRGCLLLLVVAFCQVDVPLEVVHLTDEYWERVVSYFFNALFF